MVGQGSYYTSSKYMSKRPRGPVLGIVCRTRERWFRWRMGLLSGSGLQRAENGRGLMR